MEDLTKQQMILLTLLVSFVASIATSVSVVSLLNETPTTITQTVNRIVEKTIEKVVPAQMADLLPSPAPIIKILPATNNDDDKIVKAVETNLSAVASIRSRKTGSEEELRYGVGFVVSSDGLLVTDKNAFGESVEYSAVFSNGATYKARRVYADENSSIAIFQLFQTRDEKDQNATDTPSVSFAPDEPKPGSSVVAIGGKDGATVYKGIVSEKTKTRIISSIPFKQIDRGGILFGMDGKVFGMNVAGADEEKYTLPSGNILSAIESYRKTKTGG